MWELIHNDIFGLILSYCSLQDLTNCILVCKHWKKLLSDYVHRWESAVYYSFGEKITTAQQGIFFSTIERNLFAG